MKAAVLFAIALLAYAEPPPAVLELLRTATEALANGDANAFLRHFDPAAPGYAALRQQVTALVAATGASSTTEVTRDQGDTQKRRLDIDWVLRVGASPRKRATIVVTVELRGTSWKITNFEPADFFSAP
jgi:murein L,D-transpeptidase YcbB/YkuD